MSIYDSILDDGIAVNVNGSYGQLTRDPKTGALVADVNTTGRPVYGQAAPVASGSIQNALAGLPSWAPMTLVIGLFVVAMVLLARRR